MTRPRTALAVMLLLALVPVGAAAHHGWSGYDASKPLTLEGTIRDAGYEHPHGYVKLETPDKTWLVVLAYTELRLAKSVASDHRLPWERSVPADMLTPYRVRRAFSALLLCVGTPANAPKPCGRSPGRPSGHLSAPAPRHPVVRTTPATPPRTPKRRQVRAAATTKSA